MIVNTYTRNTKNIWFPAQREPLYDPDDERLMEVFVDYWAVEKQKLKEGFTIPGTDVHVSGWLYWHTVYWKIAKYIELPNKKKVRIIETPDLRDLDWDIANDFIKCETEGKFYDLVGARDFGKTVIAASRAGWLYTLFNNSESVISAGELSYIKVVTEKIEDGLINIHPIFIKKRILNDWKKEVTAGWKDKVTGIASPNSSLSTIKMKNYEAGNKTMAANGTRPGFHLLDEQGTIKNLIACVKDSDGCWWSGNSAKPSCLFMLAGTGGDMEVGAEAAEIFYNPVGYNMLEFNDEWEGRGKIGRFISALRARFFFKEQQSLAKYLNKEGNIPLESIPILVSNQERALKEWWEPGYAAALKSGNQKTVLKFKAYWPLKPSDSFLVLTKNDFNVEAAMQQQKRLKGLDITGLPVELYHDGESIKHKTSDKHIITQFPLKDQSPDAPVIIWEHPVSENPPFGLYTAGVDPYRHSTSEYSNSLGAVYIFKRVHDITGERYQNMFVACYVARPDNKEKWNETARLLIKYYNAYTLCENDEYGFIDYMVKKNDASRYLAPQPQWLKDIVPNTSVRRDYGIHRSSDRIRHHLDSLFKKYLDDVIYTDTDNQGNIISETLGVTKVLDNMLLEEIIKFNFDGNFDRVVAAELAVAMADHLNPQFTVSDTDSDPRLKSYFGRHTSSNKVIDFHDTTTVNRKTGKRRSKLFI